MTGTDHFERIGTISAGSRKTFEWSIENQPAYREPSQMPLMAAEYEADDGRKYQQISRLRPKQTGGGYHYTAEGFEAPRSIKEFSRSYDGLVEK